MVSEQRLQPNVSIDLRLDGVEQVYTGFCDLIWALREQAATLI